MPSSTNQSQSPRVDADTTHAAIAAINQPPNTLLRPSAVLTGSNLFANNNDGNGNAKRSSVIDALPTPAVANNNYKSITPSPTVDTADNAVATKRRRSVAWFLEIKYSTSCV